MEPPGGGRLINGCIVFNGSRSVFYSGQVLEGNLTFDLKSPLHISAIDILYLGQAKVEWTEEQEEKYGGVRRTKILNYIAREQYFNFVQRLVQGPTELATGTHSIPFSYQIPFSCPSSFKGEKGQVTYFVKGYVILQDGVTKETIHADFDVIAPMNLNTGSPDIKNPLVMEFEEEMSCQCFCASSPLAVTVRLPAQGMCPGQTVPITVSVRNKTSVELNKIIFQITTRERYHSEEPVSDYEPPEEVLTSMKKGPILSNTTKDYVFHLRVPDFIAPNMENCGIIDVGYFFKVIVKTSGCNEDLEDEAEICIGLVPLGESDVRNHPMIDKLPIGPIPDPSDPANVKRPKITVTPNQNPVQIRPPGPIPYPVVANVADKPIYGSKNSLVGPFEIGFRAPDVNSGVDPTLPGYPGVQGQNPLYPGVQGRTSPYPGIQGQTSPYPGVQGRTSPYPGIQGRTSPYPGVQGQNPPYPTQGYGSQPSAPSAPPPY